MTTTFDDITFLARSPNRIAVLRVLCEGPSTRSDLRSTVDVSSPTIGRILSDLERRDWVRQDEHYYEITPLGTLVTETFTDLLETMETVQHLRHIVRWLPTAQFGFGVRCLADATLTVPTNSEPSAPTQRAHALICGADRLRTVSHTFNDRGLTAVGTAVMQHGLSFEGVFPRPALQHLAADPEQASMIRDVFAVDEQALYATDSAIPFSVTVVDECVYFLGRDEHGVLRALVETTDETVRAWAVSMYEAYQRKATQIDGETVTEAAN